MVGIIGGGIVDGIVERVGIMIEGIGIVIKGIGVIERVATFPSTELRHFAFLLLFGKFAEKVEDLQDLEDLEGLEGSEDLEDKFPSTAVPIDRVLEAEEKRGHHYPAILLMNAWSNQCMQRALFAGPNPTDITAAGPCHASATEKISSFVALQHKHNRFNKSHLLSY